VPRLGVGDGHDGRRRCSGRSFGRGEGWAVGGRGERADDGGTSSWEWTAGAALYLGQP